MLSFIAAADIKVGDIAAEIEDGKATLGPMKGWDVYSPFEISQDQFSKMLAGVPTNGELIQNKRARILKLVIGTDDNVSSALVIFRNDHQFLCSMLFHPNCFDEQRFSQQEMQR